MPSSVITDTHDATWGTTQQHRTRERIGEGLGLRKKGSFIERYRRATELEHRALSPGVKWPGREADRSPPASAEVKKTWVYTCTPLYAFMA
jgi:hypothetical protein